ncbi:MAG: SAM-dependent DNA methyltransferase, partial [Nitrospinae bacterium]|nr:SAM-dependent DNA methyltransferase [Nitrospinota bacterium]
FRKLAESKKRRDSKAREAEIEAGLKLQEQIRRVLASLDSETVYMDREVFNEVLDSTFDNADVSLKAPIRKAILSALGERDPEAEICRDAKSNPEPDPELRDTELVPLPDDISLPLPMGY